MSQPYGQWSIEKAELGGTDITASLRDYVLDLSDDNGFVVYAQQKRIDAGNLLYANGRSDALDITSTEGPGKGNTVKAIYQQPDAATLIICYNLDGAGARPADFHSPQGTQLFFVTYKKKIEMKRVTGIGGVFFKSEDPKQLKAWYQKHLEVGEVFQWTDLNQPDAKAPAQTIWSPFKKDTTYFAPSEKPFMLNYRVHDLRALLAVLREEGVTIVGEVEEHPYGKFGWILDPEGNKIELWEPID